MTPLEAGLLAALLALAAGLVVAWRRIGVLERRVAQLETLLSGISTTLERIRRTQRLQRITGAATRQEIAAINMRLADLQGDARTVALVEAIARRAGWAAPPGAQASVSLAGGERSIAVGRDVQRSALIPGNASEGKVNDE